MLRQLYEDQRPLVIAAAAFILLTIVFGAVALFDQTQILGINRWIKPIKFSSSIAIYFATLAVYLYNLRGSDRLRYVISWVTIVLLTLEMFLITLQAARGTTSHFNRSTVLDGTIFTIMGAMIAANTVAAGVLLYLYFKNETRLSNTLVWGFRLGLLVMILGSIEGGYMSSQTGHSVGAVDGGPGLPFVNWSTIVGDLRVAHFMGLHAFQIVPIVAYVLERIAARFASATTIVFAVFYAAFFTAVFVQALLGRPFIAAIANGIN